MFDGCCSLKSVPDISKWNPANLIDKSDIFIECSSLKSIPDISKWKIKTETLDDMLKDLNDSD